MTSNFKCNILSKCFVAGWLLAIQAWMTIAFLLSFGSLVIIALIVIRYPLRGILHYEWLLTGIAFICTSVACKQFFMFYLKIFWFCLGEIFCKFNSNQTLLKETT